MKPHPDFRTDIQGLRTIAVALVVVFHLWPGHLSGGYVGVDVFFVISGYLITGALIRAIEQNGRINLLAFYAARAKRLLPAATVVLIAILAGTFVFLPASRWEETVWQVIASALYVQNWYLADQAVDYLSADLPPSPAQHYWSLSIEEQFYIIWPLLMLAVVPLGRRLTLSLRRSLNIALGAVFLCSLAASLLLTYESSAKAYFVSHTRFWELALGGLLAINIGALAIPQKLRFPLSSTALIAIIGSAFVYSAETPFPGLAALIPTLATAAIILAEDRRMNLLLSYRPMTWAGDRSYSIYLWHWPIIVFAAAAFSGDLSLGASILIIGVTLIFSDLSYRYVEQPARRFTSLGSSKIAALSVVSIGACIVTAAAALQAIGERDDKTIQLGVAALADPQYDWRKERLDELSPMPQNARNDLAEAYNQDCFQRLAGVQVATCSYGSESPQRPTVALVGDSHAVHWFPTFERLADQGAIYFVGIAKSSCALALEPIYDANQRRPYGECAEWSQHVVDWLGELKPDLVIISQSSNHVVRPGAAVEQTEEMAAAQRSAFTRLQSYNIPVAAIRPTPWLAQVPADCLLETLNWASTCATPARSAIRPDALTASAAALNLPIIETQQWFCLNDECPPVIGGVIVYRDRHHLTATYARTLTSEMGKSLLSLGLSFKEGLPSGM